MPGEINRPVRPDDEIAWIRSTDERLAVIERQINDLFAGSGQSNNTDYIQQGVISGGTVVRNSASQVTVAAGSGWILQASGILQRVTWPATVISGIPAASANGRVDQVAVASTGVVSRLQGATASTSAWASLDDAPAGPSRAAVPVGSMRLSEFVVGAGGIGSAVGLNFRDRRTWARGAYGRILLGSGASFSTASGVHSDISSTLLSLRMELTGVPVHVKFAGYVTQTSQSNTAISIRVNGATFLAPDFAFVPFSPATAHSVHFNSEQSGLGAGSKLFRPTWAVGGGTAQMNPNSGVLFSVREILQPIENNGTA